MNLYGLSLGVNLSGRIQSLADALRHNVTLRSLSIDGIDDLYIICNSY
jgi:hypothetical protein